MLSRLWSMVCLVSLVLALVTAAAWLKSYVAPGGVIYYGNGRDYLLKSNHGEVGYAAVASGQTSGRGFYVYWNGEYRKLEGWRLAPERPPVESGRFYLTTQAPDPPYKDRWGLAIASDQPSAGRLNFQVYTFPHWVALLAFAIWPVLWLQGRSRRRDPVTGERVGFFSRLFGMISFASLLACLAVAVVWGVSYLRPVAFSVHPVARTWRVSMERGVVELQAPKREGVLTVRFGAWAALAATALLPTLWLGGTHGRRRRKRRLGKGLCPMCSEELGESKGRCERCGWAKAV